MYQLPAFYSVPYSFANVNMYCSIRFNRCELTSLACRSPGAGFAMNLPDAISGAMRTGNFGIGINTIKIIVFNHLEHLSRRSAVPERAKIKWASFPGLISRAQRRLHDCRDTAISRSESPQYPKNLSARLSREQSRARREPFRQE
jgi:hypothetical protein